MPTFGVFAIDATILVKLFCKCRLVGMVVQNARGLSTAFTRLGHVVGTMQSAIFGAVWTYLIVRELFIIRVDLDQTRARVAAALTMGDAVIAGHF